MDGCNTPSPPFILLVRTILGDLPPLIPQVAKAEAATRAAQVEVESMKTELNMALAQVGREAGCGGEQP